LVLILLVGVLRLSVVGRLAVAWGCATKSPAGATVRLVAALSATTCGDASYEVLVISDNARWIFGKTYEKMKKRKNAPKMIRPSTSQRTQLFHVL
jgi:hypothetical protein